MRRNSQSIALQDYRSLLSDGNIPAKTSKDTKHNCWGEFFWTVEILSCACATIILGALVILLAHFDDLPMPDWPQPITINAIVSTFTVAFKALLLKPLEEGLSQSKWLWFIRPNKLSDLELFDQASRGPWGCLCLLYDSLKGARKRYLAVFGALLSIVALGIDPMSQGIVQYYECQRAAPHGIARIPLTNQYTAAGPKTGTAQGPSYVLDGPMTVAIYMGLLIPPTSTTVSIECSTGYCNFPATADNVTFSSVAMCHSCDDITSTVHKGKKGSSNSTSYELPSGLLLSNEGVFESKYVDLNGSALFTFEALMKTLKPECADPKNGFLDECTDTQKIFAVRCSLTPCLTTYSANMTEKREANGTRYIYEETAISSKTLQRFTYILWGLFRVNSYELVQQTTIRHGSWEDCNPSPNATDVNTYKSETDNSRWYPPDCVWTFSFPATMTVAGFLETLWATGEIDMTSNGFSVNQWFTTVYNNGTSNFSVVDKFMKGVALALTSQIRRTPDSAEKTPFAQGTALKTLTCIKFRKIWIIYPATLLILTIIFLSLAIFQGRSSRQPWHSDWKSSSLAILFHGLDPRTRDTHGDALMQKEMMKAAEQTRVQLLKRGKGWWLSEGGQSLDQEEEAGIEVSRNDRTGTGTNAVERPPLQVAQNSTTSLLAPSIADDDASSISRTQNSQPGSRRSSTV
ncbi:hypothetical protein IWZ01DRAFT_560151 [Phyllosticta capitalensis]